MGDQGGTRDAVPHIGLFLSSLADMGGAIRVSVLLANRLCADFSVTIIELTEGRQHAFPLDDRVDVVSLGFDCDVRLRRKLMDVPSI